MFSKTGFVLILAALLILGGAFFFVRGSHGIVLDRGTEAVSSTVSDTAASSAGAPITLLFGGDLMFDRYIRTSMRQHGGKNPLKALKETLEHADLVVANLEGPITENASLSETSEVGARENYFFTFDPRVAPLLKRLHIDVVNIGNNHIMNFGQDGVSSTKRFLSDAGVGFFGSPLSGDERMLVQNIKGARIALVNYNQFVSQGKEKALEDIATAKRQADVVIVYTHWGTEYVPVTEPVKALAHQFIDAGADLIIGSHPHIVQAKEVYQGKTIYYSLGNLVFDQYFSEETRAGLLVRATLDPETKEFSFEDIPVTLKNTGETILTRE